MGSRYFENCSLDERFTLVSQSYLFGDFRCIVCDWDQRRIITVSTSWKEEDEDFIFKAVKEHIDNLPPNAYVFEVSRDGELLSWSHDVDRDRTLIPFYPSVAEFSQELQKIRRSELTEIDRFGLQVDLTTYESAQGQTRHAVFEYYTNRANITGFWDELNCMIRIPRHQNIVPLDRLVFDTIDGEDRVVGFTTPFIPGGTILYNKSRVFKLKHLQQLIKTVDYLNLRLGIVHGDIGLGNLLIDTETDDIKVFDFNWSDQLGSPDYEPDRNDVKYVVFGLYEIITRDLHFREEYYPEELDSSVVLEMKEWEKHPEVQLDCDIHHYRQVLEDWLKTRAKFDQEITIFSQAPDFIDWPPVPEFPLVPWAGDMVRRPAQLRNDLIKRGVGILKWQRPGSSQLPLPQGQRLLATGEIVYESQEISGRN